MNNKKMLSFLLILASKQKRSLVASQSKQARNAATCNGGAYHGPRWQRQIFL